MSKLIPMEEAAKVLGLSVEKLNELRVSVTMKAILQYSIWGWRNRQTIYLLSLIRLRWTTRQLNCSKVQ